MSYWLASVTEQSNWSNALTFLPRTNCYHHYLVLIPSQIHCSLRLSLKPTETIPPSSNVIHRHLSTILSVTLFSFPPMLSSRNNMKFAPFQTSQTATQPPFGWRHCYRSTFSTVVFLQRYPIFSIMPNIFLPLSCFFYQDCSSKVSILHSSLHSSL